MPEGKHKALVLPGAGARGAYQVGVLKAVASMLPAGAPNPFAIIAGTSAGAINAAVLAGRAANFERGVNEMEQVWANFHASHFHAITHFQVLRVLELRENSLAAREFFRAADDVQHKHGGENNESDEDANEVLDMKFRAEVRNESRS